MTATNKTIAETILLQLGGNRFIAMTGSKNFLCDKNWLSMHLKRNKSGAKFLKIHLNEMDLYDMVFTRVKKTLNKEESFGTYKWYDEELIEVKRVEGIGWEQLQEIFTEVTGFYTSL